MRIDWMFRWMIRAATYSCVLLLAVLLIQVSYQGLPWLDWQFLTSFPSRFPAKAGYLMGGLFDLLSGTRDNSYIGSGFGKKQGYGPSYAPAGPCYYCGLTFNAKILQHPISPSTF